MYVISHSAFHRSADNTIAFRWIWQFHKKAVSIRIHGFTSALMDKLRTRSDERMIWRLGLGISVCKFWTLTSATLLWSKENDISSTIYSIIHGTFTLYTPFLANVSDIILGKSMKIHGLHKSNVIKTLVHSYFLCTFKTVSPFIKTQRVFKHIYT